MNDTRMTEHPGRTAHWLVTLGVLTVLAWSAPVERAAAGEVDHEATQAGYARPFFAESDEHRIHELSRTVLEINNDLGVDLSDPNSRKALGEILAGDGLAYYRMIFDRMSSHWSVQLLPMTDSEWQLLDGDRPGSRHKARLPERFNPGGVRSGTGGGSSAGRRAPELNTTAVPEPTTIALFAAGGLLLSRRPRRAERH